ncbi:MAG: hypothetical protein ACYC2T_05700 [Bacillota bacterium]
MWNNYRHVIIVFGLISLLSFITAYRGSFAFLREPAKLKPEVWKTYTQDQIVAPGTKVFIQNRYRLCNHQLPVDVPSDLSLVGIAWEDLDKTFAQKQGWTIEKPVRGTILLTRQVEGLCPEDAVKRHLGAVGDYVAVFIGPVGINGGLEKVTQIRVGTLPEKWQELVRKGALDFHNEQELLQALDSFDEYY